MEILLEISDFDYEKFMEAMASTENNAYELWKK
jgi:hypothetical protein